ncbi:MAG: RNA methyltransferase [Chitinophagaceae bacterium]
MFRKLSIEELHRKSIEETLQEKKIPVVVVLDNIRSMHNVGSIFRTADSFQIEKIFLCGYTPQPPHRDIEKTALGATKSVAWQYFTSTIECIQTLMLENYTIIAIEQVENSVSLENFVWHNEKKIALIIGNELKGVSEEVLTYCNHTIEIPQQGMKHSLNVSIAGSIVMWESFRAYTTKEI